MKRLLTVLCVLAVIPFFLGCRIVGDYSSDKSAPVVTPNIKTVKSVMVPVTVPASAIPPAMLAGLPKLASIRGSEFDQNTISMVLEAGGHEISFGTPVAYRENPDGSITLIYALPLEELEDRGIDVDVAGGVAATALLNLGGNAVAVPITDLKEQVIEAKVNEVTATSGSEEAKKEAAKQEVIQAAQEVAKALARTQTEQATGDTGLANREQKVVVFEVTIAPTGAVTVTPTIVKVTPTQVKETTTEAPPPTSIDARVSSAEMQDSAGTYQTLVMNADSPSITNAAYNSLTFKFTLNKDLDRVPTAFSVKLIDMTKATEQVLLTTIVKGDDRLNLSYSGKAITVVLTSEAGSLLQPGRVYKADFDMSDNGTLAYNLSGYYTFKTFQPTTVINLDKIQASRFNSTELGILTPKTPAVTDFPLSGGRFVLTFSQALTQQPAKAAVRFLDQNSGAVIARYSLASSTLVVGHDGAAVTLTTVGASGLQVGTTYNVAFALEFPAQEGVIVALGAVDVWPIKTFQTQMTNWTGKDSTATANRVNPNLTKLELTFSHNLAPNPVGEIKVKRYVIDATVNESEYIYGIGATQEVVVQGNKLIIDTKDKELVPERKYVISYQSGTLLDADGNPVAKHGDITIYTDVAP